MPYTTIHTISRKNLDTATISCSGQMKCKIINSMMSQELQVSLLPRKFREGNLTSTTSYFLIYHHFTSSALESILQHIYQLIHIHTFKQTNLISILPNFSINFSRIVQLVKVFGQSNLSTWLWHKLAATQFCFGLSSNSFSMIMRISS